MNKLLLVFLSVVLFILLAITGTLFFTFSQSGNDMIKEYIQTEAEASLQMPVSVRKFSLEAGKARLIMDINQEATVEVVTHYDLLEQSFAGIYHIKANHFKYKEIVLRQADINGHFKGVAEDIFVDGKGTALDARLAYKLRVVDSRPQNIEAVMRGVALAELLELAAQPPLAEGKIDIDVKMPDIGKEFANGYGHMVLHKSQFNTSLVQKMYDLDLPKKSYALGNIDFTLKGTLLHVLADVKSNLFVLKLGKASVDIENKKLLAEYDVDVKEMGILTQNKLSGALKIVGNMVVEDDKLHLKGKSHSLGGILDFDVAETSNIRFEKLALGKILHLLKQPAYAQGLLSGTVVVSKDLNSGNYDINVQKGLFGAKSIEENFGYQIPSKNSFALVAKGKIDQKILKTDVALKSTLSDMTLSNVIYDIQNQKLESKYDIFLPNIGLLIPDNKAAKRGYMSLKGDLKLDKSLRVNGVAKGLGDSLSFSYDSKTAKVDAKDLFVEKLLSLGALPRYVKGKVSTIVDVTNIKTLDGTFVIKSNNLVTQAHAMEELIGKKLTMQMSIESKGKLVAGKAYVDTKVKTSMGNLKLDHSVINTKDNTFSSKYMLNIPDLEKAYVLTEQKLYGSMVLSGEVTKDKHLKVTGSTTSLGGKIVYTLVGDNFNSTLNNVPIANLLHMAGQAKIVQGNTKGTMKYNLKTKVGVVDVSIDAFKIKPNSTTNTVKMFIGKDPSRIIFSDTKLHADIKGDRTMYSLIAKGSHAAIEITKGVLDKKANTHRAKFKFIYEKYVVTGSIGGSINNPSFMVDPSSMMQSKVGDKIQKKLDKALGGDVGKAVGGFLKGFKF